MMHPDQLEKIKDTIHDTEDFLVQRFRTHKTPEKAFQTFDELQQFVNSHKISIPVGTLFKTDLRGVSEDVVLEGPKTACPVFYALGPNAPAEIRNTPFVFYIEPLDSLIIHPNTNPADLKNEFWKPEYLKVWGQFTMGNPAFVMHYISVDRLGLVRHGLKSDASLFADLDDAKEYLSSL